LEPDVDLTGQLLGAKNVLSDGGFYDIVFLEGTCADLFDGCDDGHHVKNLVPENLGLD
jgi:hypothetical protein